MGRRTDRDRQRGEDARRVGTAGAGRVSDDGPVLITGGAGFIGANLADRLASDGHRVRVYDALTDAAAVARWARCEGVMALYRAHTSGSVSTRDPIAFTHDCLTNSLQVEERWSAQGSVGSPMSTRRHISLVNAYAQVAEASCGRDEETFERALERLLSLEPGYVPPGPLYVSALARGLGYKRAEVARSKVKYLSGRFKQSRAGQAARRILARQRP